MRLLFVINPVSGAGQKDWQKAITEWFSKRNDTIEFYTIRHELDNNLLLKKSIDTFRPDRVVAAGGDGTVKAVAEVLIGQAIPLAIIPAGSANGMAKELEIPLDEQKAFDLVTAGKPFPLDLIFINGEYCIHLSDIGLNATMLKYFEHTDKRGFFGYAKAMFKAIGQKNFMEVSIQANNKEIRRKVVMVVFANASKYGTGAVINPNGKTHDGLFELVIVRRLAFTELVKMLITQRPFDPAKIEIIQCKRMRLRANKTYPFQVDGEYRGKQSEVDAVIEPSAIQVVLSPSNHKPEHAARPASDHEHSGFI
jgi:diacylglycerol kinase (ATP)